MILRNARRFVYKTVRQPLYAFGVFYRRLKAAISYSYGKGKSSYPEAITLFLTHRCNLRCKMCGQWGEGGVTKGKDFEFINCELSLQEVKNIIEDVAFFKPNITLFGGEPLLHPGCVKIIREIKQKGMHCLMITNGYLLDGLAEEIVGAGLDELNVSLDGSARLHDEIRGSTGLFDKIMQGLQKVNYFKAKSGKNYPLINLQCTINKYNYKNLEELLDVAQLVKANSLTFHNLIFLSADRLERQKEFAKELNCSFAEWKGFVFEPGIDPQVLYAKIRQIMAKPYKFSVDFYPNLSGKSLNEYYKNPNYLPCDYPARCLSPWMVAYIFPDGEVRPCLNCSYSYGNIRTEKFLSLWNNYLAVKFRKTLKDKRIFPVCARCTELYRY
jgi:MoaA/NifB/PqqE/SkfB family radical SAM enzyme